MKKLPPLFAAVLAAGAIVTFTMAHSTEDCRGYELLRTSIESISAQEGGEYLTCYCALMSDANCAVNNNGSSKCAGGANVKCWEYNRNCN